MGLREMKRRIDEFERHSNAQRIGVLPIRTEIDLDREHRDG
jgi:hypothetical protein